MIPADAILDKSMKAGTPDAIDFAWIRHTSGGSSHVTLKTYEQGREAFDGDAVHVIWLDEEPALPIYTESLLRTMTTKGIVYVTFTPLQGISDVVKQFLYPEPGQQKKFYINATWNDAPHLDEETRKKYFASIPPHQRKARTEGVPDLGAGVIYPIAKTRLRSKTSVFQIIGRGLTAWTLAGTGQRLSGERVTVKAMLCTSTTCTSAARLNRRSMRRQSNHEALGFGA